MMKTFANAVAFLILATTLVAAQMQMPTNPPAGSKPKDSSATPKTLTGVVSDSMCGAKHMAKDKSPAECTRMCVKQGMQRNKIYTLEGHEAELDKLAGARATVKGSVAGDVVTVASVKPAAKKAAQ